MNTMEETESLCDDMLIVIFLKLPVKSIIRCKKVCKEFNRIISCPYFIREDKKLKLMFLGPVEDPEDQDRFDFFDLIPDIPNATARVTRLPPLPQNLSGYTFRGVIGCANGLICIHVRDNSSWLHVDYNTPIIPSSYIIVGNPFTGSFIETQVPIPYPKLFSFAYDESRNDYSLLVLNNLGLSCNFSLISKSWEVKKIEFKKELKKYYMSVCMRNSVFWMIEDDMTIVEFDLRTRSFVQEIMVPALDVDAEYRLIVFEDKLNLLKLGMQNVCIAWQLHEDGWRVRLEIPLDFFADTTPEMLYPMTRNGEFLILRVQLNCNSNTLFLITDHNILTEVMINDFQPYEFADLVYLSESIVSPHSNVFLA